MEEEDELSYIVPVVRACVSTRYFVTMQLIRTVSDIISPISHKTQIIQQSTAKPSMRAVITI